MFRAKAEEEFGRRTLSVRCYLPFDDRSFVRFADRPDELSPRERHYVGARLFDALFHGETLRLYVHLLEQVRHTGAKMRVRLKLEPMIVARLPWECLYDTREAKFLSMNSDVTLVRYVALRAREPQPVAPRHPLKVLLVAQSGSGPSRSRVTREAHVVAQALSALEAEGVAQVVEAGSEFDGDDLTSEALAVLLARKFDIVHLIADATRDGDGAVFSTGRGGVELVALARTLAANRPGLVIWSGGSQAGALAPSFADGLLDAVPALLSQRISMPGELLMLYTLELYRALGAVQPVDTALAAACSAALSQFPSQGEWVMPGLYLSRKDAAIFESAANGGSTDTYQISEGRYRRRLRESLNRFWPKPERYFPQLLRWMPRTQPLVGYVHAADFLGQPQSASELSRRFQRLLLFGEGGSGKSMALYRLFYEAAQPILAYEKKSPLPIYLALADLQESKDLFELLSAEYDRELFASDLEEGRFLFLFDGLDGLSAAGAARRTDALNNFMRRYPMNRFVVSTRRPSPRAVDIPNWVEMLPFAEWEAMDFLMDNGGIRAESAKILYAQLAKTLGARAGNPQLLAFARRLWREGARVPTDATGIFQAFLRVAGSTFAGEDLLPQLAFFMSKSDRVSLLKAHLEDRGGTEDAAGLAKAVAFRSTSTMSADELMVEISKTRLLRGPAAFAFPNLAFQEFLTAHALLSAPPSTVVNLIQPADWRQIDGDSVRPLNLSRGPFHGSLPFLCGLKDDGPRVVELLVEKDLVLACACFHDSAPSKTVDLMLRSALGQGVRSGDAMAARIACLGLEARGDAWAVDLLERLACEPVDARALALEALGNLRSIRSVPVLESAVEASDTNVANAAMDALARIQAS